MSCFWKFLLKVYSKVLHPGCPVEQSVEKRHCIWMDTGNTTSVQGTETMIDFSTSLNNARSNSAVSNWMWCIKICFRGHVDSVGQQWRLSPGCLPIKKFQQNGMQLWDLWQGNSCNNTSIRRVATLYSGIRTHHDYLLLSARKQNYARFRWSAESESD